MTANRRRTEILLLVMFAVLAGTYLICAGWSAWKIQTGTGSVYTAVLAGVISLPWSMLVPRDVQTPGVLSFVTLTSATTNSVIGWLVVRRIQRVISGRRTN